VLRKSRAQALSHDSTGFAVVDDRGNRHPYSWDGVLRATAFKRDLLTVDLICLAFELAGGKAIELHEELAGWDSFVHALPSYLPGVPAYESWWRGVAVPAFKPNETILFDRQNVVAG